MATIQNYVNAMKLYRPLLSFPAILLAMTLLACASAPPKVNYPDSIAERCTTTSLIHSPTLVRANKNLTRYQKRQAILSTLETGDEETGFFTSLVKGEWYYEDESDDAIFIGFNVRSHHILVAAMYVDNGLETILCDSENMKQTDDSIHRKAPKWKMTLNKKLKMALAKTNKEEQKKYSYSGNASNSSNVEKTQRVQYEYDNESNIGYLSVRGKTILDRPWMLKQIADICASKHIALTSSIKADGGSFAVLDESINDNVFTIKFEALY